MSQQARTVASYETRTSSSSYNTDGGTTAYRPVIAPRNLIIQRTSSSASGHGGGSHQQSRITQSSAAMYNSGVPAGAYANVTNTGVTAVKSSREREKKDMQDLNERFASYIEKVRFLEAQNRRLADELEKLKSKWGKETTQIKAMYQAELDEARRCLDDADKEKARLEIRDASLEEQLEELRARLNDANNAVIEERERNERQIQQLSDFEAEVGVLRRRVELLESDREKDKKRITILQEALNRARTDLDNETLLHIDAENRRQTLEEELEFLKAVHEQELKELAALAYRDTTAENREFWKNEMGQALREIHQIYDDKLDSMKGEMETFYNLKISEFRTGAVKQNMEAGHAKDESRRIKTQVTEQRDRLNDVEGRNANLQRELDELKRDKERREGEFERENNELKMEISQLRAEMEAILKELQGILESKLGLELEIAAYRKLLEGEESRGGLRQIVESLTETQERRLQQSSSYSSNYGGGSASGGGGGGGGGGGAGGSGGGGGYGASAGFSSLSGGGYGGHSSSSSSTAISSSSGAGALDSAARASQILKGEMSAKTTFQRSAKGPISIAECSNDGKFITLENTGRKEEELSGFSIRRNIDGNDKPEFAFNNVVLQPGATLKIWASGAKPHGAHPTDLEYSESWGAGSAIRTILVNQVGEDRATHIQKTVYS